MFPIRHDSLSVQHLAYLRLSRIQDTAQFAKVRSFSDSWKHRMRGWREQPAAEDAREDISTRPRHALYSIVLI